MQKKMTRKTELLKQSHKVAVDAQSGPVTVTIDYIPENKRLMESPDILAIVQANANSPTMAKDIYGQLKLRLLTQTLKVKVETRLDESTLHTEQTECKTRHKPLKKSVDDEDDSDGGSRKRKRSKKAPVSQPEFSDTEDEGEPPCGE